MDTDIFNNISDLIFKIEVFDELPIKEQRGLAVHFMNILNAFTPLNYHIFFEHIFPD